MADRLTRISIASTDRCKPKKCVQECEKICPFIAFGKLCTKCITAVCKIAFIFVELCIGCTICVKKCAFEVIQIINLPNYLDKETTHRYGSYTFKLHRLLVLRPGQVLALAGTNGIGKSAVLKVLAGKLRPNLGHFKNAPDWQEILTYFRGSELQNYFTRILEHNLKAIIKPQFVDHIPKAVQANVGHVLDKKDERGMKKVLCADFQLNQVIDLKMKYLSDGELQRFATAVAASRNTEMYSYVLVVEQYLCALDYLPDFICCLYGKQGAYGVDGLLFSVREGINIYLAGFVLTVKLRFREKSLTFKCLRRSIKFDAMADRLTCTAVVSSDRCKTKKCHQGCKISCPITVCGTIIMALPIDIMINIFLKLPVKSLFRCECVCKVWRDTINTAYFVDQHRTSSAARDSQLVLFRYFKEECLPVKLYAVNPEISSNTFTLNQYPIAEFPHECAVLICNLGHGLFLLGARMGVPGFLYNPTRRQRLILPPAAINTVEFQVSLSTHGLCFDKSSKQYTLVRVSRVASRQQNFEIEQATEVYTLGSNKWKQISAIPPNPVYSKIAVPAYGDIHWVTERRLVSFEIRKEEFKVAPFPDFLYSVYGEKMSCLFTWREKLAVIHQTPGKVGIWVLRDYDKENKWEEVYALPFAGPYDNDFGYWEGGVVFDIVNTPWLVMDKEIGIECRKLVYWDFEEGCVTPVIIESPSLSIKARPYEKFTSYTVNLISLCRSDSPLLSRVKITNHSKNKND